MLVLLYQIFQANRFLPSSVFASESNTLLKIRTCQFHFRLQLAGVVIQFYKLNDLICQFLLRISWKLLTFDVQSQRMVKNRCRVSSTTDTIELSSLSSLSLTSACLLLLFKHVDENPVTYLLRLEENPIVQDVLLIAHAILFFIQLSKLYARDQHTDNIHKR